MSTINTSFNGASQAAQTQTQRGYELAREFKALARVSAKAPQAPETQVAMKRLDSILSGEKPVDKEVPRGYYLNITV